jgi:hypothetical protein
MIQRSAPLSGTAVDYPYESSHEAVAGFEQTTLSTTDREKIAHGNAERILRLRRLTSASGWLRQPCFGQDRLEQFHWIA